MALPGSQIWRDYATDGVAASGPHRPVKSEIREWSEQFDDILVEFAELGERVEAAETRLGIVSMPTIALTFDTYRSAYTIGRNIMLARDLVGTFFVVPENIDVSLEITRDELLVLLADGWEIGGYTNEDMTTLFSSARSVAYDRLVEMEEAMAAKDFKMRCIAPKSRLWDTTPYGNLKADQLAKMAKPRVMAVAARDDAPGFQPYPIVDPWYLTAGSNSWDSTTTGASIAAIVDDLIAEPVPSLWIPNIHEIGPTGDAFTVTTTNFTAAMDYIAAKRDAGQLRVCTLIDALWP